MNGAFDSVLKYKNLPYLAKTVSATLVIPPRRVALILREHFSLLAFTGAIDALVTANLMSSSPIFEVTVVGGSERLVLSDVGIPISADCELSGLDERKQDMIVVCGGYRTRLKAEALLRRKLQSADAAGVVLGGLWNGSYFLAEAGLLDGYECAFHPDVRATMVELFPKVQLSKSAYVIDRKRISCAGANSSLKMMLEVIRHRSGENILRAIQEVVGCDDAKEIADVSVMSVDCNPNLPEALRLALELMSNNVEELIELDDIAQYAGCSRRHLERLFIRHVNATPQRYYMELRLTRARQLVQNTNMTLSEISVACGFATLSHFCRCFRQLFGMVPREFRAKTQSMN